ncbi:N-acetyltransferase [Bacillus sp. FJAT-50079]|uniref:GNAT family N-acetyltransferase n=1 Tax=Bacillus sp. FJAT-50079 TaxID=2833577 RepID=UPI001BC8D52A|nr:N-acetyltransferase [Bacillus sp. FJAT-50079]MBS4208653.1 N-acetyltransferase [Bacillus sp. FJAT-50079]
MIIRTETPADYSAVFHINYQAFDQREDESKLIERIRKSKGFIPELSIVAEKDGEIVGNIVLSKAKVSGEGNEHDVLTLAPIAVQPVWQQKGIGRMLVNEGLKRAKELGYDLVFLIGHPTYYPKFGFKQAKQYGVDLKQFDVPEEVFMVCELRAGELNRIKGELRYPSAFFEVDE